MRYHGAAAESDFRRFLRTLPRASGKDGSRCAGSNVAFGKGNVVALCKDYFPEALKKGWESVSLIGLWISNWLRVLIGLQNPRVKQKVTYLYRYYIVVLFFNLPKKG